MTTPLDLAIANNIAWYCVECDSHGISYTRRGLVWYSAAPMPPYHSNLIVARDDPLPLIEQLRHNLSQPWSIKDALARHDLSPAGFSQLFTARWLYRPSGSAAPLSVPDARIERINSTSAFHHWQRTWDRSPEAQRVFHDNLYRYAAVDFYQLARDGELLAGCATNVSEGVVGITNTFGPAQYLGPLIMAIAAQHPERALVCYERTSTAQDHLKTLDFVDLGGLTIWHNGTAQPDTGA